MNQPHNGKPRVSPRVAFQSVPKRLLWSVGIFGALLLALFIASFFLDEPLRRYTESKMNRDLKGYSVRIPGMHVQLLGLSATLKGLTVIQQAHPDPPIAYFPVLRSGVHWREILSGRLVAELRLYRPKVNINLLQLRTEAASKVPLKKLGWQQAVEDIYPLKVNALRITDGEITYIDQDPKQPLRLSRLNLRASNIRNISSPDKVYPSPFHLETAIFGSGRGVIDGKANFLAEPHLGIDGSFDLKNVPIDYFKPVIARANLSIRNGLLSASGRMEYAPKIKVAHVRDMEISDMEIDYIHSERTKEAEIRRAEKLKKAAGEVHDKPGVVLRLDQFRLKKCTLGMVNKKADPPYRVFLADTDLRLTNLSNRFSQGPAKAQLQGKFMGSGITAATAQFRPEKNGPDFDLNVKIEETKLAAMNDLFRAYGDFDVSEGAFSFYSELHIKDGAISGYVKPFFKDMKVYDKRQDKEKKLFRKLYEIMVGGVAKLLESTPREEVATKADISGMVDEPRTSTWQIMVGLVRNAFFKAILPGFEEEVSRSRKK
ncbi:DUF748 domain-containing protein [bacterium]|nr:DUF748 domain-containing protein [bacterium]